MLETLGVGVKGKLRALWKRLASSFGDKRGRYLSPVGGGTPTDLALPTAPEPTR